MTNYTELANRIRRTTLEMICNAGSGHLGASFSSVECLIALYYSVMSIDNADYQTRDRFILSKGHAVPALYSVFYDKGWIKKEDIMSLRQLGSVCQGHPVISSCEYIDATTGSLGQGLSIGAGMALGIGICGRKERVYVLLGDGELNEGQIYEAALFASHRKLSNLIAFVDKNGLQMDGRTSDIIHIESIKEMFNGIGWKVLEADGHDVQSIISSCDNSSAEKPTIIILNTVKGKGVSFMENSIEFHMKIPDSREYELALSELNGGADIS